ncbi:porin [Pseudoduganella albidiflava]|uniref:Porin n=1 Tax=Pseudoduganella albidiflava TaxID=321983 RepID=A0A411X5E5_9BURK|nr:porin [Pseudoduganella albidiflava]QBI04098.1 porin [Pseudoduganella albidiflava]GGY24677.1 porin [Pseudoduganella albidiflava]
MKKSLVALALTAAFGGAAAQSSVTIYGTIDAGIQRTTHTANDATQVTRRDNNKLGFRGVEDLGNGLKALFQLEIRYDPDTGALENNVRPLFQGQSRVGLQGAFGTVRIGRGLTAYQETSTQFEPWSGLPAVAGYQTDLHVAGYSSDPLSVVGNSINRFSNAVFYNTPVWAGFQVNVSVATKEANNGPAIIGKGTASAPQYAANSTASANPYSVSATYTNGPFAAMVGAERNAIETELWSVAASYKPIPDLKLMASYQRQDLGHTMWTNENISAWVVGANYTVGANKFLVGYGQKDPDGVIKTKQASVGYEYSLSPRTYLYLDLSVKKAPFTVAATNDDTRKHYALGVHHNF